MIDYGNRRLYGAGGKGTIQDLLKGLSAAQVKRMRAGMSPGDEGGDFAGMSPARLQAIAAMMHLAMQAGEGGAGNFQLQHRLGDGLFQQAPPASGLHMQQHLPPMGIPHPHPGPMHQPLMPGGGVGGPPLVRAPGMPPVHAPVGRPPFAGGLGRVNPPAFNPNTLNRGMGGGNQLYPMLLARAGVLR